MKQTLFTILFYLGCARELEIANPQEFHYSKHHNGKSHVVKRGKWQVPTDKKYNYFTRLRKE